ncbi:formimidoyltransferase-cyclodeaminase-like [Montipora foliosa]|uniref:formimidoyltransferase-cyclodeaminase-like n=1 Tax=Montipora foliosa TaxID=591990 RepID=UPI0035F17764
MGKIIECVPNFSEGRNKEVIDAIAQAIASVEGCSLLDVDPGMSTNRTVYTFVGSPESVVEGALNGARCAMQLIDMTRHHGEHKRLGALDVCPFIPVQGATMDDCVQCAKMFGERAALELGIPVYLYGYASNKDYRKTVPQIRAGEYEGLSEKIKKEEWKPDYGPVEFLPTWGATIAGARKFLIAYNINILGTKEQAHRLALNLRAQGRGPDQPGRLPEVQGMGWYLDEANLAQVSLNLLDYHQTNIHTAFEECVKDAKELKLAVCGSQIVGLVPLGAMLLAADHFIENENLFILCEDQKIRLVIERLGLSSVTPFDPKTRIIEYLVDSTEDGPLVSLPLRQFIYSLGSRSSAPGGGSASAAMAAMGVALATMVGWLSYGNKKFESLDSQMRCLIPPLRQAMLDFIPMIDADTKAFSGFMEAKKLSKGTPEEEKVREKALQDGLRNAVQVPLLVIRTATKVWNPMVELAKVGNVNSKSDLQVGARSLETAVWGAFYNVKINLNDITDETFSKQVLEEAHSSLETAQEKCKEILNILDKRKS